MTRDKFNYSHADNGKKPASALNFEKNERPDAQQFDWWWATVIEKINKLWDEFTRLDSDNDGVVDAADDSDTVDGKHYSDIQNWVNNSSDVPNADKLDGLHAEEIGIHVRDDGTITVEKATGINVTGNATITDDGDGTVTINIDNTAETLSGNDDRDHTAGSSPEYPDKSTGESNTARGDKFVVKENDGYHEYLVE